MLKIIKRYILSYSPAYWGSILTILILALALFVSSNVSKTPTRQMITEAHTDSSEISEVLFSIEREFNIFYDLLNELANEEYSVLEESVWLERINDRFTIVLESFHSLHPSVSGYFVNISSKIDSLPLLQTYTNKNNSKISHISVLMNASVIDSPGGINELLRERREPVFITIPNDLTKKLELSYIAPLYISDPSADGECEYYMGFFGVTVDIDSLKGMFGGDSNRSRTMTLLTENLEILASSADFPVGARLEGIQTAAFAPLSDEIRRADADAGYIRLHYNGKFWMNIFVILPSGQIFWESFLLSERLGGTNLLIAILSAFAFLCLWMVQKRDSVSPFDNLTGLMFKGLEFSDEQLISYKASFGTHIGFVGALFALSLYTLIGSSTIVQKASYAIIFIISAFSIRIFKKVNLSITQRYIYLISCLLVPVIMHHLAGGFAVQNGSRIIPWCVITVTISSFILNEKQNRGIFALFVTVLFLDAVLEIFLIPGTNPEYVIRFMTIIFFLGFALFVSTDLYVTGVQDVVKKLNEAYMQLQNAQSKLVNEEKMITLGRLIAGIAHEVNTPLGAIKASAEGIESSLQNAFSALMDSHGILSDMDKVYFFRLMNLANDSMSDMYTSMQIRRAKPQILAYFAELGLEEPETILQKLVRLEICNLDRIRENQDIFVSHNIMDLLSLLIATTPIIKGSYIILEAAGKAYKIIFALKSYSHTNVSSDPIMFDLTQNIDNTLLLLYNQIKLSIDVIREYDTIPELLGNPDELGQVWLNIIQNAIYAMSGGGILIISIKNEGDWVHVSITDNGPGIPEEVIPGVFEPFYTTKPPGEGTGLGLDICKRIVTEHNGRIEAESVPGIRTAFHIWLPVK